MNRKKKALLAALASLLVLSGCNKEVKTIDIDTKPSIIEKYTPKPKKTELIKNVSLGYLTEDATFYNDKGDIIGTIAKNEIIIRKIEFSKIQYIETFNGQTGYIKNENILILDKIFVLIDISDQTITLYVENEPIYNSAIVTGKPSTPTYEGEFEIAYKQKDTILRASDGSYASPVQYWMPFNEGIGLHDADGWRDTYGGDIYLSNGSHGCVNMPTEAASLIYDYVDAGTQVLVKK